MIKPITKPGVDNGRPNSMTLATWLADNNPPIMNPIQPSIRIAIGRGFGGNGGGFGASGSTTAWLQYGHSVASSGVCCRQNVQIFIIV